MTPLTPNATKANEVSQLLNDCLGDLLAGTRSLGIFETSLFANATPSVKIILHRMCLSHLVITLSKWAELYDHYGSIFPRDVREACRNLRKEIERRGIKNFRNTVVGHIGDKKLRRPLTAAELENRLALIVGDSLEAFLMWINNPAANRFPETVVSVCERTRDSIREEYRLGKLN